MGDTRIRYGLAYGRMNNFITGSTDQTKRGYLAGTDGLFLQANTCPDVTNGYLFYTNNSAATTITNFGLSHPSAMTSCNLAGLFEGKVIKIVFLDSNTTLSGSRIVLASTDNLFYINSVIDLVYRTSSWYEIGRANARPVSYAFSAAGSTSINADLAQSVVVLNGTATPVILKSVSGGYVGQSITVVVNSGGCTLQVCSNGNIILANTSAFAIKDSAGLSSPVTLVKVNTSWWAVGF